MPGGRPKSLDVKVFFNPDTQKEALFDYMNKHPKMIKEAVAKQIHEYIGSIVREFFYYSYTDHTPGKVVKTIYEDKTIEYLDQLIKKPAALETLFPEKELQAAVEAQAAKNIKDAYFIRHGIDNILVKSLEDKLQSIMATDSIIKKFYDDLTARLRERIAATSIDEEVNRLLGRRNR